MSAAAWRCIFIVVCLASSTLPQKPPPKARPANTERKVSALKRPDPKSLKSLLMRWHDKVILLVAGAVHGAFFCHIPPGGGLWKWTNERQTQMLFRVLHECVYVIIMWMRCLSDWYWVRHSFFHLCRNSTRVCTIPCCLMAYMWCPTTVAWFATLLWDSISCKGRRHEFVHSLMVSVAQIRWIYMCPNLKMDVWEQKRSIFWICMHSFLRFWTQSFDGTQNEIDIHNSFCRQFATYSWMAVRATYGVLCWLVSVCVFFLWRSACLLCSNSDGLFTSDLQMVGADHDHDLVKRLNEILYWSPPNSLRNCFDHCRFFMLGQQ